MQIHSLDLVDDYSLIGIHTSEEDCKLAYLLNLNLHTKFKRSKFNLDFENKNASFPIFEFINEKKQLASYLISNKCVGKTSENSAVNLFSKSEVFSSTTYLIREKKNVDYFMKIEGDISTIEIFKTIEKLNKISQIVTSYHINPLKLRSKDFLIF
ncbi:MAG: hypothetical protein COA67_02770 [Lutibacter sp.]|nr:MAG: hypothetical protein COA67_02770 [Lutibacter sp.]